MNSAELGLKNLNQRVSSSPLIVVRKKWLMFPPTVGPIVIDPPIEEVVIEDEVMDPPIEEVVIDPPIEEVPSLVQNYSMQAYSICPVHLSFYLIIPVLYIGCLIWWDLIPDVIHHHVIQQNVGIEQVYRNALENGGEGKITSVMAHQFPHERANHNIAMWMATLTIAFAVGIVHFLYIPPR